MKKVTLLSVFLLAASLNADIDDDIKRNTKEFIADLEAVSERIEDAAEQLKDRAEDLAKKLKQKSEILGATLKEKAKQAGATIARGVESLERDITDYVD